MQSEAFSPPEILRSWAEGNLASTTGPARGKRLTGAPTLPHPPGTVSSGPGNAGLRVRRRPSLIFIDCSGQSTVRQGFKGPFRERVRVWLTNSFREPQAGSSFLAPRPLVQASYK